MTSQQTVRVMLGGVLLAATLLAAGCTKHADDTTPSDTTSSTTVPDEQKPPLLRDSWTPDDLAQLAEIDVPGYDSSEPSLSATALERTFASDPNPAGTTLEAHVRLTPCDADTCWDLTQAPDAKRLADLRALLPAAHRDDPDLVFEYGPDELIGDFEAFTLYWRSFAPGEGAATIGYHVLYHDGLNRIEITVTPTEATGVADDEALDALMPRDWAREVTADVFAAYADEFNAHS